jgi:hypothetical protein
MNIFQTFEVSFFTKMENRMFENNDWLTKWIKTYSKHKLYLYLHSHSSNNQTMKIHYRTYWKV